MRNTFFSVVKIVSLSLLIVSCTDSSSHDSWEVYGGNKENNHYSSLNQITKDNVSKLQKAWVFSSGDSDKFTQIQANPIIIDSILYGVSPKLKLFALNAKTGQAIWSFNPYNVIQSINVGVGYFAMNVCRGVTYFDDGLDGQIFYAAGSSLFCVNAKTGHLVEGFGKGGSIDLHNDLGRNVESLYVAMTTSGIIYNDVIIIGTRVDEGAAAAPGHIRAYDVNTGALRWIFHTIPQPGEVGYDSWEDPEAWKNVGGANSWAGFSMDERRGIVYAPVGSASYDFYGGKRKGNNLFANSILALDAATGKRIWHYQTVHHDLWDRDLPTAPVLVTVNKDGRSIDALAQITKSGFVFLLDRITGEPIFPIPEVEIPHQSLLIGEKTSPTQPIPVYPKPFARQQLTEADLNTLVSDSSQMVIKETFSKIHKEHLFYPPSAKGTLIFPGYDGGGEWGGAAYNPKNGLLFVNASEMPWILTMVKNDIEEKNEMETNYTAGKRAYKNNCMACHGINLNGTGNFPSIINVKAKFTEDSLMNLLKSGRRMMPAFNHLSESVKKAIASYVLGLTSKDEPYVGTDIPLNTYWEMPYTSTGYNKFLTPEGYPAINPPWGTLNAINLNTGDIQWKITYGDTPEFEAKGIHTGSESYGGPAITENGLLFIAGTKDKKFRAYNQDTGELLWETELPFPGFATPSIYQVDGKQFVVIACGGGKLGAESGDNYVAFSLPD